MMVLMIYVKIKHPFWSNQPVFHVYSLRNWLFPKGIIDPELPKPNKFCDFFSVKTIQMRSAVNNHDDKKSDSTSHIKLFSPELQKHFVNFVRENYLQTKIVKYSPTANNIFPYFRHHNHLVILLIILKDLTIYLPYQDILHSSS